MDNKEKTLKVVVYLLEAGRVRFTVPPLNKGEKALITIKPDGRRPPALWWKLFSLSRPQGGTFIPLLFQGFLKSGGISIEGWVQPSSPVSNKRVIDPYLRTVIQADGNLICQIDPEILKLNNCSALINGYDHVRNEILKRFKKALHISVVRISGLVIFIVSVWCFTKKDTLPRLLELIGIL